MPAIGRPIARGYTLVEIVTVIAILAIVSAIALPQFGPRDDLKTASAVRQITADLLYAQSRAIATAKTHYIVFDGANGYCVMDAMVPPHIISNPISGTPYQVSFSNGPLDGVSFSQINFDGNNILAFDSTGIPCTWSPQMASPSPLIHGSIALHVGDSTRTLSIQPLTGAINVH